MTKKLYINNPYLKETHATIISKSFKDESFLIKLDRTIFFPNMSGGQPRDLGTIEGKNVINVYEDGRDIIHVIEEDIESNKVHLSIDWENRFDLMQNHTGQHILSDAFKKLLNAETIGFHMGEKYITIDIELPDITEDEISKIEALANRIIQSNFKVLSEFSDSNSIEVLKISKIQEGRKTIRIVNIDNISSSPCCGTHVGSTGEIGLIKIINFERYKGNTRVSFICGNRALKDYSLKNRYIKDIALSLSSGVPDVLEKFLKLKEDKENMQKENRALREELISLKAEILLDKKKTINHVDYVVENLGNINKEELNLISSYLEKNENLIQIYKLGNEDHCSFLVSKSHNLDIDLKEIFNLVAEKIIVKGGGNKQKIQGTTSLAIIDRVIEMFYREIKNHFKD
ncbi:alanyl-tRNA editing protein [Tissierella creatinophila]|uniref:Alanine--tRNA ligase n=1 Tax=Tissierella creatinophila DSM 6911 TaxID=1123403 RepID=A0A1U7M859_TISCR|nr:DHHA1 domain-containing protein [Tissierella creatinophila]OLS03399.1 alanine--tRNA ligase [Tissierella creatinophila DSM 6911]